METILKPLFTCVFNIISFIVAAFVLGLSLPLIVSAVVSVLTPCTFSECTAGGGFWFFTVVLSLAACFMLGFYLEDHETNKQKTR